MFCCIYLYGKHQLRYVLTLTLTYLGVVGIILNLNVTRLQHCLGLRQATGCKLRSGADTASL